MNCSDPAKSALRCTVDTRPATISKYMVCHTLSHLAMCDGGFETLCVTVSVTCTVHKHQLCDNVPDCWDGADEASITCTSLTSTTCSRYYLRRGVAVEAPVPVSWIRDGTRDCLDGTDEEGTWDTCGTTGTTFRYKAGGRPCQDVYLCRDHGFIEREYLCDGVETCGNELKVCNTARGVEPVYTRTVETTGLTTDLKNISYCIRGLDRQLLQTCKLETFRYYQDDIFGVNRTTDVVIPIYKEDCSHYYGESYLYLSCTGRCIAPCPLKDPLRYDSCVGQFPDRIYTLSGLDSLTFLVKTGDTYHNNFFQCDNRKCVEYSKVCDLTDDCGDGSDEQDCRNHFQCNTSQTYIPISKTCNGVADCNDLSDECNERCSGKQIINGLLLKLTCWTIGILAVLFNSIILHKNLCEIRDCKSMMILTNKLLITLVCVGDLMVGLYLIIISIIDVVYGDGYCRLKYEWLSSTGCSILGVVSTTGSQLSLFSMTVLSVCRYVGVHNILAPSTTVSRRTIFIVSLFISCIIGGSLLVSVVPILPGFTELFVNGLWYGPNSTLFIGIPNRAQHMAVLEQYYGRIRHGKAASLKWNVIVNLVQGMFSQDYGKIFYREVDFYGNDGVCLFKYFVDPSDPQHKYVWTVLSINFVCFIIITICYILINIISRRSSEQVQQQNEVMKKRSRRVQQKITLIIATDFLCWVPFIITCALHSLEVIDAAIWYSFFSIVVLPVNSVINPLLYDHTLLQYGSNGCRRARNITSHIFEESRVAVGNVVTEITETNQAVSVKETRLPLSSVRRKLVQKLKCLNTNGSCDDEIRSGTRIQDSNL